MTPAERATTYAYCLVTQAKDFLDKAYRAMRGYGYSEEGLKDLPEIRKAFTEIDEPLNKLASAFSKEMSNITDFANSSIN